MLSSCAPSLETRTWMPSHMINLSAPFKNVLRVVQSSEIPMHQNLEHVQCSLQHWRRRQQYGYVLPHPV